MKTKDVLVLIGGVWGFVSDSLYSNLTFDNALVLFPSKLVLGVVNVLGVSGMSTVEYTLLTIITGVLLSLLAGYTLYKLQR